MNSKGIKLKGIKVKLFPDQAQKDQIDINIRLHTSDHQKQDAGYAAGTLQKRRPIRQQIRHELPPQSVETRISVPETGRKRILSRICLRRFGSGVSALLHWPKQTPQLRKP